MRRCCYCCKRSYQKDINYDEMNALINAIKEKSGADRSYLLAQQTCSAVLVNPKGAKIRIRRHLQMGLPPGLEERKYPPHYALPV